MKTMDFAPLQRTSISIEFTPKNLINAPDLAICLSVFSVNQEEKTNFVRKVQSRTKKCF